MFKLSFQELLINLFNAKQPYEVCCPDEAGREA